MSTRWKKLRGDLQATPGRFAMMLLAITVSAAALTSMLFAYTVLTREMSANYAAANPAAAQLSLGRIDLSQKAAQITAITQAMPEIAESELSATVRLNLQVAPGQTVPALLFVVDEVSAMRLNKGRLDSGAWPQTGQIVLERKALGVAQTAPGQSVQLGRKDGPLHSLVVSGAVHDPALAPAQQEGMVYGYISFQTLAAMQEQADEHILKLSLAQDALNVPRIEQLSAALQRKLAAAGIAVQEIRIPPPGRHPHQRQMTGGVRMLLMFSVLAMLLGALLIATNIWTLLVQQTRQIAMMKAVGAGTRQIMGLYAALVLGLGLGLVALLLGLPLGVAVGKFLIKMTANNLNLEITSFAVPWWLWLGDAAFCLALPLLMAYLPIRLAAGKTVREALDDHGISGSAGISTPAWMRSLGRLPWLPASLNLALRNMLRRRGRLALCVLLLATAGAMFMASRNLLHSWDKLAQAAAQTRLYDLQVRLQQALPEAEARAIAAGVPGVSVVESWPARTATPARADGLNIVSAYPDGGHGSLRLRLAPPSSKLIQPKLEQGGWLDGAAADGAVLNQAAHLAFFAGKKIGDSLTLLVEGRQLSLRLQGILVEPMTGAAVYVGPAAFKQVVPEAGSNNLRIAFASHDSLRQKAEQTEAAFKAAGQPVDFIVTEDELRRSTDGHLMIMVMILTALAAVMALVGLLGLSAAMSASVAERIREFAVQRTLGAVNRSIVGMVLSEAVLISLCGYLLALPLALAFSGVMVQVIAGLSAQPLGISFSAGGALLWLALLLGGAVLASLAPALNAARFTIREVLTYG